MRDTKVRYLHYDMESPLHSIAVIPAEAGIQASHQVVGNGLLPAQEWGFPSCSYVRVSTPQKEGRRTGVMAELPLEGIRVIELTQIAAGPYATQFLGDWGAEVIRLENLQTMRPGTRGQYAKVPQSLVDQARASNAPGMVFPNWEAGPRPWNRYTQFTATLRSRKSMTVDLLRPEGKEILGNLVKTADVFIENNVPETVDRLGISYEWLKELRPDIIMIRMPAFGLTGPYANYRCLGLHVDGVVGHHHIKGYPDVDPSLRGDTVAADAAAGAASAFAVLSALWYRDRTGKGQMVEMCLSENFIPVMADPIMDYNMNGRVRGTIGNRDYHMAPHGAYRCKGEEKWATIAVGSDREWESLCEAMGRPELAADPRFADAASRWNNQDDLDAIVNDWTSRLEPRQVFDALQAAGVPSGPVLDDLEILEDPQMVDRGFYQTLDHEEVGTLRYHGPGWSMSRTPQQAAGGRAPAGRAQRVRLQGDSGRLRRGVRPAGVGGAHRHGHDAGRALRSAEGDLKWT